MTNDTLKKVLKNIDISRGISIRKEGIYEAILLNYYPVTQPLANSDELITSHYNFVVLLYGGNKAGIILDCSYDIHIFILKKYRGLGVASKIMKDNFIKRLWPYIEEVTCYNINKFDIIRHLANITGFTVANEFEMLERLGRLDEIDI